MENIFFWVDDYRSASQKILPNFNATRKFIIVSTRVRHLYLPYLINAVHTLKLFI